MEAFDPREYQSLQARLDASREKLEGLLGELAGVDCELEAMAPEQERHRLLSAACSSLEQLSELGAEELFWGQRAAHGIALETLRDARGRLDAFQKRLGEIETRRQEIRDEIAQAEDNHDVIEDDLVDAQERAEKKAQEWLIEREDATFAIRASIMPWARDREEDRRFRRSLLVAMLISMVLGLVLPLIDLPLPDPFEIEAVPERFARLIEQRVELPPPPPVVEETLPEELERTEEPIPEEAKPKSKPEVTPESTPGSKGILAFREKFSSLASNEPAARLGAAAKVTRAGEAAVGRATRNMVATTAPGSSGGINLASLSRDVGGGDGDMAGVEVARATSSIGTGTGSDRPLSDGPGLSRTDEEIQIVFDRHKSALYRLYNRELRRDPTLRGQMLLRLRIEPDGSVSLCEVQSSELAAPKLGAQVAARVKTFDFGAKEDVPAITILYPIDFLPAT